MNLESISSKPCTLTSRRQQVRPLREVARAGPPEHMKIRPGTSADLIDIIRLVADEKMNPLGLDPSRFFVGKEPSTRLVLPHWGHFRGYSRVSGPYEGGFRVLGRSG